MSDVSPTKILYSRKEASAALSISVRQLDLRIATGEIAVRRIGSRVLIAAQTLFEFASADRPCLPALAN